MLVPGEQPEVSSSHPSSISIISDSGGRGSPFRELLNITHAYHVGARGGWGGGDSVPSKRIFETVLTVLKYS